MLISFQLSEVEDVVLLLPNVVVVDGLVDVVVVVVLNRLVDVDVVVAMVVLESSWRPQCSGSWQGLSPQETS